MEEDSKTEEEEFEDDRPGQSGVSNGGIGYLGT